MSVLTVVSKSEWGTSNFGYVQSTGSIRKIDYNTITHSAYVTSGMSSAPIMFTSNWNALWGIAFPTAPKNFI